MSEHSAGVRSSLARGARCGAVAIALLWAAVAQARPITYTGFTITDGSLGAWTFHNARVFLTFKGDTDDVQFIQPLIDPAHPEYGTVDIYMIATGQASVTVVSGHRAVSAKFDPNQLFVSLDLGDTDPTTPHIGGRGVGFGSFNAASPGGIEPAYPLGIEDGTIDWGDPIEEGGTASPALYDLSTDLQHDVGFSGRAWTCPGFPDWTCPRATTPLTTDLGDLFLYQPYQEAGPGDVLGAGFFVADTTGGSWDAFMAVHESRDLARRAPTSITYNAFVVTDVMFGRQRLTGAQLFLTFQADVRTVVPLSGANGYVNDVGEARLAVVGGGHAFTAHILPHQLYVYFDVDHSLIGFASYAGGLAYPLVLSGNFTTGTGLIGDSTLFGVTDLMRTPADATLYTPATATLVTDLTNETVLSGGANSCLALDPATSACSNFSAVPIHTDRGDLWVLEPYTGNAAEDGTPPVTINWGIFWSELGGRRRFPLPPWIEGAEERED